MLVAAFAQLRFALALASSRRIPGWALDRLVAEAAKTAREFGVLDADGALAVSGPVLDPEARRTVQPHRFRAQAKRAAADTGYYSCLFRDLALVPGSLDWEGIAGLPLTAKDALRADPEAFVRSRPAVSARPAFGPGSTSRTYFAVNNLVLASSSSAWPTSGRRAVRGRGIWRS